MLNNSALAAFSAVEGAVVFDGQNPASSLSSPVPAGLRAGPGGVAIGRFGWTDANGTVRNTRLNAGDALGFIIPDIPINSDWRNVFFDEVTRTFRIREGLPVTMLRTGKVWAKFVNGAQVLQPVYANILDGSAISGYSLAGELTRWSVSTPTDAQALAIITTWRLP